MKLRLVNFRCYTDKTFDFDNVVLISAENGAGKSSILLGIQYCLYGSKTKGAKLVKYGKSSCMVELYHNKYKIQRTSKPCRLELVDLETNKMYEDEGAQGIINEVFGDCFTTTSFMTQNPIGSFIIMSPIEKLEFLERFSFKGIDIPEIKARCKTLVYQKNEELQKTISQLEVLSQVLNETKEPEEVRLSFKYKPEDKAKYSENIEKLERKIQKMKMQLSKLRTAKEKNQNFETYKASSNSFIESSRIKLNNLILEKENSSFKGNEYLENLKETLKTQNSQKEFFRLQNKFEEDSQKLSSIKALEMKQWEDEILRLETELGLDIDEISNEYLHSLKDCLQDSRMISMIKQSINEISLSETDFTNEIEVLKNQKVKLEEELKVCLEHETSYLCPCCDARLQLINNDLVRLEIKSSISDKNQINSKLILLSKKIEYLQSEKIQNQIKQQSKTKLEKELNSILSSYDEDANLDEDDLQIEISETTVKLELKEKLSKVRYARDKLLYSKSCLLLEADVKMLKAWLDTNSKLSIPTELSSEDLQEAIQEQIIAQNNYKSIQKQITEISTEIQLLENEIELKSIENQKWIYDTETETSLKNSLSEAETKLKLYQKRMIEIQSFSQFEIERANYDNLISRIDTLKETEKLQMRKLTCAKCLKEEILKAESISVGNIIDTINSHAQLYLDIFFEHEPITVSLKSFRESKKNQVGKAQINVEVQYKGEIMDLETLSGGELSRVILAFTLALNEISDSPLLLLDESTASLNQEATSIVFDAVQEHCKNRTCLIIGHQIVEGTFNNILRL